MKSHFETYLTGMDGAVKKALKAKSLKVIGYANHDINMMGRIFDDYPREACPLPFSEKDLNPLTACLQEFIMSVEPLDYPNTTKGLTPKQAATLTAFVNKMAAITCVELLDEDGNLLPAIIDHFGDELRVLLNDQTILDETPCTVADAIQKQFMYSYFVQILTPYIFHSWQQLYESSFVAAKIQKHEIVQAFDAVLTADTGLLAAIRSVQLVIHNEQKTETTTEKLIQSAKQVFIDPLNSYLTNNKGPDELLQENISKDWQLVIQAGFDGRQSVATLSQTVTQAVVQLYNKWTEKRYPELKKRTNKFEQEISIKLTDKTNIEISKRVNDALGYVTAQMQKVLRYKKSLQRAMSDYKLYGQPLARSFKARPNYQIVKSLPKITEYFNQLMTEEAEARSYQTFAVKLLFFAISKLYQENGKLKSEASKLSSNPLGPNLALELISTCVTQAINTVARLWLNDETNQKNYINNLDIDYIKNKLKKISEAFKTGLTEEFLQQVLGFPFLAEPRINEKAFVISMPTISLNSESLALLKKLSNIKETIAEIKAECAHEAAHVSQVEICLQSLSALKQTYLQKEEVFSRIVTGNPHQEFADTLTALQSKIQQIQQEYRDLRQLIVDLQSNSLTAEFDNERVALQIAAAKSQIASQTTAAEASLNIIKEKINGLITTRTNAAGLHTRIIEQLAAIVNHEGWGKRINGGGVMLGSVKVPTKIAYLGHFLKSEAVYDIDVKLLSLLKSYATKKQEQMPGPGFFNNMVSKRKAARRHEDTAEFYIRLENLVEVANNNLYDLPKLTQISDELEIIKNKLQQSNPSTRSASVSNRH